MSYNINKRDFEQALKEMEGCINDLRDVLDQHTIDTLESVVTEYNNNFKGSVEELENECDDLTDYIENHT